MLSVSMLHISLCFSPRLSVWWLLPCACCAGLSPSAWSCSSRYRGNVGGRSYCDFLGVGHHHNRNNNCHVHGWHEILINSYLFWHLLWIKESQTTGHCTGESLNVVFSMSKQSMYANPSRLSYLIWYSCRRVPDNKRKSGIIRHDITIY